MSFHRGAVTFFFWGGGDLQGDPNLQNLVDIRPGFRDSGFGEEGLAVRNSWLWVWGFRVQGFRDWVAGARGSSVCFLKLALVLCNNSNSYSNCRNAL